MPHEPSNPPYFDWLFEQLANQNPRTVAAFGRHVHWGYWQEPSLATDSPDEYGAAAEALCRAVCDAAEIRDGMRILDVGCGFGGTLASLNERFSDLRLVGVNIDSRQLARAADLLRPQQRNSIELVKADAASIPLPDNGFDVVLAVECVFHFDRPRFFAEASRLMNHNGNLTLSDFVPSERAAEFLGAGALSADEGIRWSYGEIDLSYSVTRYRELAGANQLTLSDTIDVTANTLPTYDFLYADAREWPDAREVELFTRATRSLEKSCRKGMLGYQILKFDRA